MNEDKRRVICPDCGCQIVYFINPNERAIGEQQVTMPRDSALLHIEKSLDRLRLVNPNGWKDVLGPIARIVDNLCDDVARLKSKNLYPKV